MASNIDTLKAKKLADICANPVLWAKAFLRTVDNATKKVGPWTARWYQAEMLLDKSDKKVARCGRRTGGSLPVSDKLLECLARARRISSELLIADVQRLDAECCAKSKQKTSNTNNFFLQEKIKHI